MHGYPQGVSLHGYPQGVSWHAYPKWRADELSRLPLPDLSAQSAEEDSARLWQTRAQGTSQLDGYPYIRNMVGRGSFVILNSSTNYSLFIQTCLDKL